MKNNADKIHYFSQIRTQDTMQLLWYGWILIDQQYVKNTSARFVCFKLNANVNEKWAWNHLTSNLLLKYGVKGSPGKPIAFVEPASHLTHASIQINTLKHLLVVLGPTKVGKRFIPRRCKDCNKPDVTEWTDCCLCCMQFFFVRQKNRNWYLKNICTAIQWITCLYTTIYFLSILICPTCCIRVLYQLIVLQILSHSNI